MSSTSYNIPCQGYQIQIDNPTGLVSLLDAKSYSKVYVLVDNNTEIHCLPKLKTLLPNYELKIISISAGESQKNINTCEYIWGQLLQDNADRKAVMINLGGGVIGDMGGFAASCYMRGIDFIQMPTTLLSQVDASVGGKLGIDFLKYKNLVGLFALPQAVIIDTSFLQTLEFKELRSGFAEVIKHALIRDIDLWNTIHTKSINDLDDWAYIVSKNVEIKKAIVEEDPKEAGLRKILNFGHTIGHAIETEYLDTAEHLLHGEAISIGMVCEAYLSHKKELIAEEELDIITNYIKSIYGDLPSSIVISDKLIGHMDKDKKNTDGKIMFSLLEGIGNCRFNQFCQNQEILDSLAYYNGLG